jgi:type VI secretion system protein VasI
VFRTSPAAPVIEGTGKWSVRVETSKITDRQDVFVSVSSDQNVPPRFGGTGTPAELLIRCKDNTTSLTVWFAGQFMASSGGFDRVTYRLDKQPAVNDRWDESTNNQHMGLWSGGESIPLIKKLFGAENFLLQATPFSESSITLDFKVGGLENAVKPLREACGW